MLPTVTASEFDPYAAEYAQMLMSDAAREARIRDMSDTALLGVERQLFAMDFRNAAEGGKFEINDWADAQWVLDIVGDELERRENAAAVAKWTSAVPIPLTYTLADKLAS